MFLHPNQKLVSLDKHRFRVVCCGRRFGKTVLAVEEIKACALSKESRIVYLAPTFDQARDIAWEMLKKELGPIIQSINESRLELRVYTEDKKESYIALKSWESVESLRGQYFDLIIPDEVAMYRNFQVQWQEIVLPTLTDKHGEAMFISTPKGFNHFYDLFQMEQTNPDYKSFHFTTYDNPFIKPEEIELIRASVTEDAFAQEYLADFRKMQGLVYKEFNRDIHSYTELPKERYFIETIAGVDFGFTNPAAVLTIKIDYDGHYWIDEEFYQSGHTDAQIAEIVAGKNFNKVYPDPENPAAIKELKDRRVNVREVIKGNDSIKNGIDRIRELLKSGRIHINKRCGNLIWEFETYAYPDKKDQRNAEEKPIKENDHALDALRYAVMMQASVSAPKIITNTQRVPTNLSRRPIYKLPQ